MGKRTEFLYLSEPDMIKAGVLDSKRCVDVMDEMFQLLGKGDYIMGGINGNEHGIKISFPDNPHFPGMPANGPDRRFMAMVAYLGGRFHIAGEKWYGSNIENPTRGLPRSVLMVMLNDVVTGEPIALMSANLISAVRTGSVPGVGVRYLARKDSEVCTVIGAGPINKGCLQGIMAAASSLKKVVIYDIFDEPAQKFAKWAYDEYGLESEIAKTTEEATRKGDIISVAASRLKPVIIKDEWLQNGSTLILTGGSVVEESYWLKAKIIFDNVKMHEAYMEEAHRSNTDVASVYKNMIGGSVYQLIEDKKLPPLKDFTSLGEIAIGTKHGRASDNDRCVLITGGMAVEDVAWGYDLYCKAKEMGLGQSLLLWESPYWS